MPYLQNLREATDAIIVIGVAVAAAIARRVQSTQRVVKDSSEERLASLEARVEATTDRLEHLVDRIDNIIDRRGK